MPSKSTRSGFNSKRHVSRRRLVEIRAAQPEDLKYLWAAYKKGGLEDMDPVFGVDMGLEDFKQSVVEYAEQTSNMAWTITAPVPGRSSLPVAFVTGWVRGRVLEMSHVSWFPWATPRVVVEAAHKFFDVMRRDFFIIEYSRARDEKFFKVLAATGVIKRVAHFHGMYPGEATIMYVARS